MTIQEENQNLLRAGYPPLADCETLHTPGPWEPDIRLAQALVVDSNGNAIADIARHEFSDTEQSYSDECIAANARLIAAAPDMFDALRAIVDAYGDQDSLLIDQARAALAKAEGGAK